MDRWSWASGWSLGALCSSRQPSAPLATSSSPANARTWLPHTQNPQAIAPPVGNPPLPWLVTEGVGQRGGGFPLYIPCHTNPQVLILAGFCFYFNFFFFLVLIFFNKNFHFKHIYTEGICAVYWGELDPELEGGGPGRGEWPGRGSHSLSMFPHPLALLPSLFLLSFLFKTVKY